MKLDLSPSILKINSINYEEIFETKNRWQSWLDVEAALALSLSTSQTTSTEYSEHLFFLKNSS